MSTRQVRQAENDSCQLSKQGQKYSWPHIHKRQLKDLISLNNSDSHCMVFTNVPLHFIHFV